MAKIQFDAVLLEFEIQRMGGSKGLASSNTSRFSRAAGNSIELDTDTGLVRIDHSNGGVYVVPIQRVKTFEPLPDAPHCEDTAPVRRGPGRPPKSETKPVEQ